MTITRAAATPPTQLRSSTSSHFFPRSSLKSFMMFAVFLFLTASNVQLTAQTPTPPPDSDEVKRLKEEKAQSELRKGIAEDKKAEIEAKFPKPATSPLEGKTTVEGAVIESQMISYVSLSRAADRVITAIKGHFTEGENLAVYNERDINLMLSYRVAMSQIDELVNQGYCQILTTAATNNLCPTPKPTPSPSPGPLHVPLALPAALPIAQSFLGAFVDMTALLRTNVEIKGQTFVIDEGPLVAEVFRAARANSPLPNPVDPKALPVPKFGALYYPYVFPPNIDSSQGSQILRRLEDLHKLRGNASQVIDAIEKDSTQIEKAAAKIKELKKVIEETLPKQSADAVALAGTLIQANCRRLSAEVDGIKKLPEELQSDAMLRLIDRLKKDCPRLNPDKFAQLLGLSNVLRETAKDLEDAGIALGKATANKKDAEKNLSDQLALLKLNPEPSLPSPPPPTPDDRKDAATAAVAQLKAINAQFDNLVTSLIRTQGTDANPLTSYIRTERLSSALAKSCASSSTTPCASASTTDPGSYWLLLKVINAGGNNRIKTNLLVDIFTGGNRISHSGGVIIQYQLFDRSGQSVESGTVSEYTDYIKANKVPALTGSQR